MLAWVGSLQGDADIYRVGDGLAAVTSEVQRQILKALAQGSKQLPELMLVTGRSKPTLSSLHMKELLARGLVAQAAHPTDSRRKVYRLAASRVFGEELATEPLRQGAVRLGLASALDAIAAAPVNVDLAVLRAQAVRLGESARAHLGTMSRREMWLRIPTILEESGLALPIRVDLQHSTLDLRPGPGLSASSERFAALLAGLIEGIATVPPGAAARVAIQATGEGLRIRLE